MKIWLFHLYLNNSITSFKRTTWEVLCDLLFRRVSEYGPLFWIGNISPLYTDQDASNFPNSQTHKKHLTVHLNKHIYF